VDGWSSCGKSTMARQLAKKLNYIFIDSGAMYRAITLYFIRNNISLQQLEEVKIRTFFHSSFFSFKLPQW